MLMFVIIALVIRLSLMIVILPLKIIMAIIRKVQNTKRRELERTYPIKGDRYG